ncbi:MAG: hypothetical protein LC687_04280 [Actinobacteria bacterium]|nr:hypothetical protein [Actinomycetota bacterium]
MSVYRQRNGKRNESSVTTEPAKEWVTLERYCETTGDTPDAVRARRKKGVWPDGMVTCIGPNGRIWVCPQLAYRWVESGAGVML